MRILTLLILGALCVPSINLCQPKNRISLQTGLAHCFFDGSPIMNIKYPTKEIKPFNGVLINSVGIDLVRNIKNSKQLSLEAMYFFESYRKHNSEQLTKVVGDRGFLTFNFKYGKTHEISSNWNLVYGIGLAIRFGHESIIVSSGQIAPGYYESNVVNISRSDIGANIFGGFEYTIMRNLTIYSKLDFLSFIYLNDKSSIRHLEDIYKISGFPSRFDLSLKLGIGFNF